MKAADVDIVILCGGRGMRLKPVMGRRQKVLADVRGRPFILRLIDFAAHQGFKRFVLCAGHGHEELKRVVRRGRLAGKIVYSVERIPLGTGGALKHAAGRIRSNPFLVLNGDTFCPISYRDVLTFHRKAGRTVTVVLARSGKKAVGAGVYVFNRSVLKRIPVERASSLESDIIPAMTPRERRRFPIKEKFYDIGTPGRLAAFRNLWPCLQSGLFDTLTPGRVG